MPYKTVSDTGVTYSVQNATSDGSLSRILVRIPYFSKEDIKVYVDNVPVGTSAGDTKYTYTWDDKYIVISPVVDKGATLMLRRSTKLDNVYNVFNGQAEFTDQSMDENFRQMLYLAQEFTEGGGAKDFYSNVSIAGTLNMKDHNILNVKNPENPKDASNKAYVDATLDANIGAMEAVRDETRRAQEQACRCASNAKLSESNASQSESKAKTSEVKSKESEENAKRIANGIPAQANAEIARVRAEGDTQFNRLVPEVERAKGYTALADAHRVSAQASAGTAVTASTQAVDARDAALANAELSEKSATRATTAAVNAGNSATQANKDLVTLQGQLKDYLPKTGGTLTGNVDVNGEPILTTGQQTFSVAKQNQVCSNIGARRVHARGGDKTSGYWIQYEDGLQEVRFRKTFSAQVAEQSGSLYRTPRLSMDFPVPFSARPIVSISVPSTGFGGLCYAGYSESTTTGIPTLRIASSIYYSEQASINVEVIAIGRWK